MTDTKLDLDLVFIEIHLPSGTTATKTLNTFLIDEKRTLTGTRVSSDYDYHKFRAWVKDSLAIDEEATLQTEGATTYNIKDELTFETAIMLLQTKYCETFDGHIPQLRICRLHPALGSTGKSSIQTPSAVGRPTSRTDSEDLYDATPPKRGKQVATAPTADVAMPSIEEDSMIVPPGSIASDTPSQSTVSPAALSRAGGPSLSSRLSTNMRDQTDSDEVVPEDGVDQVGGNEEDDYDPDPDALLNNPADDFIVRPDISTEPWDEACQMFQCSPDIETLKFPGLKLPIKNWQVLAMFKALTQYEDRQIPGVMLGDEMGLGKTAEAYCIIVAHHYIHKSYATVQSEWGRAGRRLRLSHLPENDQTPGAVCPTQAAVTKQWGIECTCVKNGHTHKIAITSPRNPNLIIAPPGLIGNWLREFGKWVDNKSVMSSAKDMVIYTAHKEMADKRRQHEITTQVLDKTKAPVLSCGYDTDKKPIFRLGEVQDGTKYIIVVSNHGVDSLINRYSENRDWEEPGTNPSDRRSRVSSTSIGLGIGREKSNSLLGRGRANSLLGRANSLLGRGNSLLGKTTTATTSRRTAPKKMLVNRLAVGWVVMDEVHKYKGSYKGNTINPTQAFRGLNRITSASERPPMLLAVSGSIVDSGPSCWQGFIRHIFQVARIDDREDTFSLPGIETVGDLDKLQNDWEYIAKLRGNRDERRTRGQDIRKFSRNTLPLLLIARRQADSFRGKPIGEFPSVNIEEKVCAMQDGPARESFKIIAQDVRTWVKEVYQQEYEDWVQDPKGLPEPTLAATQQRELKRYADVAGPKATSAFETIHRTACYPFVAHIYAEWDLEGVTVGTGAKKSTKSAFSAPAVQSYARKITAELKKPGTRTAAAILNILKSSPFWDFREELRNTSPKIQEVERYIEEMKNLKRRKAAKGPADNSHTRHMIIFTDTALSAFLTYMILYTNTKGVDFYYLHAGTDAAERDSICEAMQRDCLPSDNHKVLIGVYSVMADGHHLPRANYCIMMDFPISDAQQKQAAARIARLGQRMDMTIVQLYDPRNLMERLRRTRNQNRALLAEATRTGDWFEWDEFLS